MPRRNRSDRSLVRGDEVGLFISVDLLRADQVRSGRDELVGRVMYGPCEPSKANDLLNK